MTRHYDPLSKLLPEKFSDPFIIENREQASKILEAINDVLEWPDDETEGYIAKLEFYRKGCIEYLQITIPGIPVNHDLT